MFTDMNHNCPVCNQAGLPNYKILPVQCPQCNADLKPYLLIHSIAKAHHRNKVNTLIICILTIICISLLTFIFKNSADYNRNLAESNEQIQLLKDSINQYNSKKIIETAGKSKENTVIYAIKKGDSMWKIARLFYGKGSSYKQIEEANNLQKPYSLRPGQLLNINLIQN
jgi:LysM repeat protein